MLQHRGGPQVDPTGRTAGPSRGIRRTGHHDDWTDGLPPLPFPVMIAAVKDFDLVDRLSRHLHQPVTPEWACGRCSELWPCEQARQDLVMDLGWRRVPIYLAVMMERAAGDLEDMHPQQLWNRFIEWTFPLIGVHDFRLRQQPQ